MKRLAALWPIAAILGVEIAVSAVVLGTGFVAVSDDDFSRAVIAERFAVAPSLDPSGTSWLPLPFFVLGTVMAALGRSLAIARAVAVAQSAAALLLVYRAARMLGLSERAAAAAAVIAAAIPTAARLGVSFQPEALTAGLVVFGAASAARRGRLRLPGGVALGAATLCRYEAWPAAFVFFVLCVADAWRGSRPSRAANGEPPNELGERSGAALLWPSAVFAIAPAAAWMIHGASAHGSAVFFLHRVAAYRAALGPPESFGAALAAYPLALLGAEPELVVVAVALVGARRDRRFLASPFARPASILAAVFAFLVAGRLAGGAPTHHDERPLLSVFWGLSIVVAGLLFDGERLFRGGSEMVAPLSEQAPWNARRRWLVLLSSLAALSALARLVVSHEPLFDRRRELAIGTEARRALGERDRLLVDTADFGYFAVIAALGAPERADAFDRRDPRDAPAPDAFSSTEGLKSRLTAAGATWFIAERQNEGVASRVGTPAARNDAFVLFRVTNGTPPLR